MNAANSVTFVWCNCFTCVIDIFAIIRHLEPMQSFLQKFAYLPCCLRVALTVAVDFRFTP